MRVAIVLSVLWYSVLVAKAAEDPSDIYYRGFLQVKASEEKLGQGKLAEALLATDEATRFFAQLADDHPDFHPEIVTHRLQMLKTNRVMLVSQITGEKPDLDSVDKADLQDHLDEVIRRNRDLSTRIETLETELELLRKVLEQQGIREEVVPPLGPQNPLLPEIEVPPVQPEKQVPENWKLRPFEGQDYYIVPLVETTETKPLSGSRFLGEDGPGMAVLKPQPAVLKGR